LSTVKTPAVAVSADLESLASLPVSISGLPRVPADGDLQDIDLVLDSAGGRLCLRDTRLRRSRPVCLDIRNARLPLSKRGPMARAVGPRTRVVVDATAGLGGDMLLLYRMGYRVTAFERHPVLAALLLDALVHLPVRPGADVPQVKQGDARMLLPALTQVPDCIYIDPMFPPKRKASALARREIRLIRDLVGDDTDAAELLEIARSHARRVVVKRPHHALPLSADPSVTFSGSLVRYDVYIQGPRQLVAGDHQQPTASARRRTTRRVSSADGAAGAA